jgi:hypothetical protein
VVHAEWDIRAVARRSNSPDVPLADHAALKAPLIFTALVGQH